MSADDIFVQALRELGWTEGQNIVIDRRFGAGNVDRLKEFAAELVRLKVDVIVAVASWRLRQPKMQRRRSQSALRIRGIR